MITSDPNVIPYDFGYCSDKTKVFQSYCDYSFIRTQSMFVYDGLPETIPVENLETYLQRNGSCVIISVKDKLYAVAGTPGGELDEYYQPTKYIVANPYLKTKSEYTIGEDCVLCKNDFASLGLTPLISRYCGLMTENLLTVRLTDINMRMMNLLSADNDDTVQSIKKYLDDLENGKLGTVGEAPFFNGLKLQSKSSSGSDYMIQFIELQQYLKGSMYNELGINANFNMKREALSGEEVSLNDDALMPLIDNMLKFRRTMCDDLKKVFGIEVSVDYGSSWHSNVVEKQLVGQSKFDATGQASEELGGDESALPDDKDANSAENTNLDDVSQLNEGNGDSDGSHCGDDSDDVSDDSKTDDDSNSDDRDISSDSDADKTSDNNIPTDNEDKTVTDTNDEDDNQLKDDGKADEPSDNHKETSDNASKGDDSESRSDGNSDNNQDSGTNNQDTGDEDTEPRKLDSKSDTEDKKKKKGDEC